MQRRRILLGSAAATALIATPTLGRAQPAWSATHPELVFAIIPSENASGVTGRWTPFTDYLGQALGTKVTLRVASDYAAVIEGQRAGNIHIASYGPASFARAIKTGAPIEAFVIEVNEDGSKGYHSVLYVRQDSAFRSIQDLRGKALGLVDPNSTSGNNVPRFALDKMGINPETFFSRVVYTGSHENAVIALQQGTVDVAANWWNTEAESNLLRMERKSMARAAAFRIVFKSDQIVNSPMAYLTTLPEGLRAAIRTAVLELPERDRNLFDHLTDGKAQPWQPVDNAAYQPVVELITFVDGLRRKRS